MKSWKPLERLPLASNILKGPTGYTSLHLTQKSREGYDPHATFHGVCEQKPPGSKDLLILLLDVTGNLLENLQKQGSIMMSQSVARKLGKGRRGSSTFS